VLKHFPLLTKVQKLQKNRSRFSRVMVTNGLPPFYGSQCTYYIPIHVYKKTVADPEVADPEVLARGAN